jgi:hypothetical protein
MNPDNKDILESIATLQRDLAKAEAEVERLRVFLQHAYEVQASAYGENSPMARFLATALNPTTKKEGTQ